MNGFSKLSVPRNPLKFCLSNNHSYFNMLSALCPKKVEYGNPWPVDTARWPTIPVYTVWCNPISLASCHISTS